MCDIIKRREKKKHLMGLWQYVSVQFIFRNSVFLFPVVVHNENMIIFFISVINQVAFSPV